MNIKEISTSKLMVRISVMLIVIVGIFIWYYNEFNIYSLILIFNSFGYLLLALGFKDLEDKDGKLVNSKIINWIVDIWIESEKKSSNRKGGIKSNGRKKNV